MKKKTLNNGEMLDASLEATLAVELFLNENYLFRRNVLNGKVEYVTKNPESAADQTPEDSLHWRPLTQEALNSIIRRAKKEHVCEKGSPKTEIVEFVHSEDVPAFNPVNHYLSHLPEHWKQMDTLHGNECVPMLIGEQGCGKTTFFKRLLPPSLREYCLDHLNLSNKFDKEMALTNNMLVILDEFDSIRPSQHPEVKQLLSKSKVNGRPIYGSTQEDRPRYASFVATTNNPYPLTDPTGSRRYICITIPEGKFIDNTGEIDYNQLYAQVLYELEVVKTPYWFSNEEVARILQLNLNYMDEADIVEIVEACFRKPEDGEAAKMMSPTMLLNHIHDEYHSVKCDFGNKIRIGKVMNSLGYESTNRSNSHFYKVVPLNAA